LSGGRIDMAGMVDGELTAAGRGINTAPVIRGPK
jgi:hypothetical protein